jgi:hypothetical protein
LSQHGPKIGQTGPKVPTFSKRKSTLSQQNTTLGPCAYIACAREKNWRVGADHSSSPGLDRSGVA